MVEMIWHEMPREVREVVEPLIEQYEYLLPSWLRSLSISYGDSKVEGSVAEILTDTAYLQAKLKLTKNFLDDTVLNRERTIVHELLHVTITPVQDWMRYIVQQYVVEQDVEQILKHFDEQIIESVVQNLMYSLLPPE